MVNKPIMSAKKAVSLIKDDMTVHIGGFLGCGTADLLIDELVKQNTKNLTIVCNDTAFYLPKNNYTNGLAPLIVNKQVKKIITSHIGTNKESGRQMNEGETEIELVPQGTLAERVRAAGFGLGGILTPTGLGTEVENGKEKIEVNGKTYLLEVPLPGDVALLKAKYADKAGNLIFSKSAQNFNPLMATACKTVIVEAENIVEIGELDPDQVVTPSIFVTHLVQSPKE